MSFSPLLADISSLCSPASVITQVQLTNRCPGLLPSYPCSFLADLWFNPVVEATKKKAVVAKISKEAGFQKYTTNFLNLLVEKDRVNLLNEICESFEEQYCVLTDTQVRRHRC